MKKLYSYLILFTLCHFLGSCKSSQHATKGNDITVSKEDFRHLSDSISKGYKAVILSEIIDVRLNSPKGLRWTTGMFTYINDRQWETMIEDKIQLLENKINDETFAAIDYFYPRIGWNPMRKCDMWLCCLDNNGEVKKRKINKNEITDERLNDSIGRVRLNINENVKGKVLVRKYTLISPYFTITNVRLDLPIFAKITPWRFQKDIPLLYGKYEIKLPTEDYYYPLLEHRAVKTGNGDMSLINDSTISEIECMTYNIYELSGGGTFPSHIEIYQHPHKYKAETITATAFNVMPLPKGSDAQPLGIEITILGSGQNRDH